MNTIKFNENTVMQVENLYPYQYNYGEGKEVLRFEILKTNHNYSEIEALESITTDVEYYENDELIIVYKGYNQDFKCSYANGKYSIEITKKSNLELRVEELERQIEALSV